MTTTPSEWSAVEEAILLYLDDWHAYQEWAAANNHPPRSDKAVHMKLIRLKRERLRRQGMGDDPVYQALLLRQEELRKQRIENLDKYHKITSELNRVSERISEIESQGGTTASDSGIGGVPPLPTATSPHPEQ